MPARRAGLKEIILPAAVRGEFDELPAYIPEGLRFHFVDNFSEVAAIAFG